MAKLIIDVREPYEFSSGHVDGAINIPLASLISGNKVLSTTPKDSEIILYCRTGSRSGVAMEVLKGQGFTNLANGINQQHVEKMLNTA